MELKTTSLENFRNQGKVEKNIRVNRDTLKLSGERVLKTTNHDYEVKRFAILSVISYHHRYLKVKFKI